MIDLQQLRWIDHELQEPLDRALEETILAHVRTSIAGEFYQDDLMDQIMEWSTKVLYPWIQNLMGGGDVTVTSQWKPRLTAAVQHAFVRIRLDEVFDLVADYPDSHPAVLELATVLQQTHLHQELGQALQTSLERRLIHPGAATSQIIDVYIHTIKVLRVVDPSDRLLQVVAEPVRAYLRARKDTVRCIITSLTSGDLYEELRRNDAKPLEDVQGDDDEEECPTLDWCPKPPLSQQRGSFFGMQSNNKTLDILSILVSIYGSKELFVDEYRLVLADKLLANLDYNTDKEVHTLELLKLRFGEQSMRHCEIMIKDTDDSKRILNNIHSRNSVKDEWKVDAAIVSHIFWPSLQKESLKHHEKIQTKLDAFSDGYYSLKNPRKLVWLDQLGTVQLELDVIEHDGTEKTKEFTCTPFHATLISHFEDKEEWGLEELTMRLELPDEHVVAKKLAYWVNQRVLMLNSVGRYEIASPSNWNQAVDHAEEDAPQQVLGAQQDDALEVYESYVLGMLQRLEELSLDRIHNNLKMFATSGSDHQYNMTMRQLSSFLQKLCKDEKLECGVGGMYKLLKK